MDMIVAHGSCDPVHMSLSQSVDAALAETEHEARDGGTVALARYYAAVIDSVPDADMIVTLRDLGPKLLAVLEALNMSPRARSAATRTPGPVTANPLDELRARRAERSGA
jgi:hypothetical protein